MKRAASRAGATPPGIFLTGVRRDGALREPGRFPFTLPLFRELERLDFRAPVTFLVGENGWGKSTLLEGLAAGAGAIAAGGRDLQRDPTLAAARAFARAFRFPRVAIPAPPCSCAPRTSSASPCECAMTSRGSRRSRRSCGAPLALPQADILPLEGDTIAPIEHADVEHVRITRAFLEDPGSFLRRL